MRASSATVPLTGPRSSAGSRSRSTRRGFCRPPSTRWSRVVRSASVTAGPRWSNGAPWAPHVRPPSCARGQRAERARVDPLRFRRRDEAVEERGSGARQVDPRRAEVLGDDEVPRCVRAVGDGIQRRDEAVRRRDRRLADRVGVGRARQVPPGGAAVVGGRERAADRHAQQPVGIRRVNDQRRSALAADAPERRAAVVGPERRAETRRVDESRDGGMRHDLPHVAGHDAPPATCLEAVEAGPASVAVHAERRDAIEVTRDRRRLDDRERHLCARAPPNASRATRARRPAGSTSHRRRATAQLPVGQRREHLPVGRHRDDRQAGALGRPRGPRARAEASRPRRRCARPLAAAARRRACGPVAPRHVDHRRVPRIDGRDRRPPRAAPRPAATRGRANAAAGAARSSAAPSGCSSPPCRRSPLIRTRPPTRPAARSRAAVRGPMRTLATNAWRPSDSKKPEPMVASRPPSRATSRTSPSTYAPSSGGEAQRDAHSRALRAAGDAPQRDRRRLRASRPARGRRAARRGRST